MIIKNILIKIGNKTLKIINYKDEKTIKTPEVKVTEKIIKTNKRKIPLKITPLLIIPLTLIPINSRLAAVSILIILLTIILKRRLPTIKKQKYQKEILKTLPFALREISTQLKAGIGLFDALKTIANGDYGRLSEEFSITLKQIQYGTNYIDAFNNLSDRVNIDVFNKVINQITRTLTNGGNLSDTLNTIANENSRNLKIKYKEYSQKLNSIMLIYMFIAVLIPVILFIMIIAATTVIGPVIRGEILLMIYLVFFPMIIIMMILFIKNIEPTL